MRTASAHAHWRREAAALTLCLSRAPVPGPQRAGQERAGAASTRQLTRVRPDGACVLMSMISPEDYPEFEGIYTKQCHINGNGDVLNCKIFAETNYNSYHLLS
ncbi:uncharacterized protein LOC114020368 [Chelonia mydas]|uniref:uncharacterized protein LOC114020368 n=1 Tax=Chelonia mydas TaxID=8469 RepID=UPI0018A1DBB5|nr:uncharacterized protein LOC114020368 [Chelonia mydas]